jgi:uncharacterized protein (DUF924 family)
VKVIEPTWIRNVLRFWFDERGEAHWFTRSDDVDAQIRDRFLELHQRLLSNSRLNTLAPRPLLAAVIVLDQFSRNLFRDDPRAFSADPVARRLARKGIEHGFDGAMQRDQRYFLYLPFEHSENRADQTLALNLITALGKEDWTHHATEHKHVIDRFGRFPHRNAALNRASTAEEIEFLKNSPAP